MAGKRPLRLEDLFEIKAAGRPALSPDGRRVVFELKRFDGKENRNFTQLMLADVESSEVRPLTRGKHNDARPCWSPDGTRVAFLSDRDKGMCLWVLPMDGGDPVRLTEPDGFVSNLRWSPDGKRLAYSRAAMSARQLLERDGKKEELRKAPQFKEIKRLFHKLDGAGWWNGQYSHIYVIPATGGKPRQVSTGDYDDQEPSWSPDGKLVSFVSNRVENPDVYIENSDLYVVGAKGGRIRKLTGMPGTVQSHSWSPDGRTVAFIGNPAACGQSHKYNDHVWLVDARGGKPRELTREIDNSTMNMILADVASAGFEAMAPIWSADSSRVYFQVSEDGAVRLYSRSVKRPDLRCEVGGEINLMFAQRTAKTGAMALTVGTGTNPGDIFVYQPEEKPRKGAFRPRPIRKISEVNAEVLRKVQVVEPEPIEVKSGKVTVHGWVLKPPGFRKGRKYPAILQIHGGPHGQYGHGFFHEMQWMAARGYVVVFSNPRGSTGHGLKFRNCIWADWGNLDYQDVMRVADWMFSRSYIDRKRVGVTGGSYGGYMTNWLVGHTQRFRAAVTQRSVVNLESMHGTSDVGYALGYEFNGTPWKNWQALRRMSPLTYVRNITTPLLIEHEEEDHRCPIEQAEQLFAALKLLGREVEMIRFEGESHGLSRGGRPQNRAERLRRIVGWFDRWMR